MITLIEIDGFKTFQNFKLELSPFQVIVGTNGAGKSNLFDALRLLTRLVDTDLRSAFQELRGEAAELFTLFPDGHSANTITLAVEMLVNRTIKDSWGAQASLKFIRMRYELEIMRVNEQGLERLYVTNESLKAIARGEDQWSKKHGLTVQNGWLPKVTGGRVAFISTERAQNSLPEVKNALLFAYTVTRIDPSQQSTPPLRVTHIVQVERAYEQLSQLKDHLTQMQMDFEGSEANKEDVYTIEQIK